MAFPFRTPKKFYCPSCGWTDSTLQHGDLLKMPTMDMKCPKCKTKLDLRDITTLEKVLRKFGIR